MTLAAALAVRACCLCFAALPDGHRDHVCRACRDRQQQDRRRP